MTAPATRIFNPLEGVLDAGPATSGGITSFSPFLSYSVSAWPVIEPTAFFGLTGDIVRKIEPHTEADPVALLAQFLVAYGSTIGRRAHFLVEADRHYTVENAVLVGMSGKGRKGTSWGHVRRLFQEIDPDWAEHRTASGLSSGEGILFHVRDAEGDDEGVTDKRLLCIESEFASILRVMQRDGNTLSATLRALWDSGNHRTLTKRQPIKTTGAHVSIIGHITADELLRYLDRTELANGFFNRFMPVCVRRARVLPEGGQIERESFADELRRLRLAVQFGKRSERITFGADGRALWHEVYGQLSDGRAGILGSVLSRAEAHVIRLATIHALLSMSDKIEADHLHAALALWRYVEASAAHIFGNNIGNPVADEILEALGQAGDAGLSRTDINALFSGNKSAAQIGGALDILSDIGAATCQTEPAGGRGRPVERWRASGLTKETN